MKQSPEGHVAMKFRSAVPFLDFATAMMGMSVRRVGLFARIACTFQKWNFLITQMIFLSIYGYLLFTDLAHTTRFISIISKLIASLATFIVLKSQPDRRERYLPRILMKLDSKDLKLIRILDAIVGIVLIVLWISGVTFMIASVNSEAFYAKFFMRLTGLAFDHLLLKLTGIVSGFNYIVLVSLAPFTSALLYSQNQIILGRLAMKVEMLYRKIPFESKDLTLKQVSKIRNTNAFCNEIRTETNTLFGVVPFVVYSMQFVYLSVDVIDRVLHYKTVRAEALTSLYVVELTVYTVGCILMAFTSDWATLKFESAREVAIKIASISDFDYDMKTVSLKSSLMLDMIANPVVKTTACGMFTVDRQFLLAFVSGLIPFTVMIVTTFLQLANV